MLGSGDTIDWAATGSMINGIGTILLAGMTGLLAWGAFRAAKQWNKDSDRKFAIDILIAFGNGRDAIQRVRLQRPEDHPFNDVFIDVANLDSASPLENEAKILNALIHRQIEKEGIAWREVSTALPSAEFVFGKNVANDLRCILRCRAQILFANDHLLQAIDDESAYSRLCCTLRENYVYAYNAQNAGRHKLPSPIESEDTIIRELAAAEESLMNELKRYVRDTRTQ